MFVLAVTMSLIVEPLTLIDIPISMDECASAISLIVLPLAIIFATVLPDLLSVSILHSVEEITCVDSTIRQSDGPVRHSYIIINHFSGYSAVIVRDWTSLIVISPIMAR
jgi:hypothetical protein